MHGSIQNLARHCLIWFHRYLKRAYLKEFGKDLGEKMKNKDVEQIYTFTHSFYNANNNRFLWFNRTEMEECKQEHSCQFLDPPGRAQQ